MLKYIWLLLLFIGIGIIILTCDDPGTSSTLLDGTSDTVFTNLPEELKGLKIYKVSMGEGSYVNVATLNGSLNSLQYKEGKYTKNVLIQENTFSFDKKEIPIKKIIFENDSIVIALK